MTKSGLIFGGVALLLVLGSAVVSPICSPCVALFIGLGAGYFAGQFQHPRQQGEGARLGAGAGALAGAGGLLGNLIGGLINAAVIGPSGAESITSLFGAPPMEPGMVWAFQIIGGLCFGLVNILIMAGLGALGGLLWYQLKGRESQYIDAPVMDLD